jgi:hypothetical protein
MAYRPVCDFWIMARPKVKWYGAYPSGFLERARALLGVHIEDGVLHVCSGEVRKYPYPERAVGPNDKTLDLDPQTNPDFLMDVRDIAPGNPPFQGYVNGEKLWPAALLDRPYSAEDHTHYAPPAEAFPENLNDLLKKCLTIVRPGGRVGVLDYLCPRPPKKVGGDDVKFVAAVAVLVGFGNRIRCFSVFERVLKQ